MARKSPAPPSKRSRSTVTAAINSKPVFAVWYGADEATSHIFEAANIPHYERSAVAGFMHMVKWRQAREALMAAPPSLPVDFAPEYAKAARHCPAGDLARAYLAGAGRNQRPVRGL